MLQLPVILVQKYFHKNCTQQDIKELLRKNHGIKISISTIKRILSSLGLKRKNIIESNIEDICSAVINELFESGFNLGYRALWSKLKKQYNLIVKRETVYYILRIADPDGVASRLANKLQRRQYLSPGPNFIWHLDGYDKLKPFGFCIHGCIDGFSRKLIWLEVATTNNNPRVTAYYFLDTVKNLTFVPTIIRSDKGSENALIESLQIGLRTSHSDKFAGEKSYIKGRSVKNQRIESYWGQMRRHTVDYYIQFFKCMAERNLFDGSSLHTKCLQYCFGPLIKYDIKCTMQLWNTHHIRKQAANNNLCGKPFVMYNLPEKYGAKDYKKKVNTESVQRLITRFTTKPELFDSNFEDLAKMLDPHFICPVNCEEGLSQYKKLLKLIADNRDN